MKLTQAFDLFGDKFEADHGRRPDWNDPNFGLTKEEMEEEAKKKLASGK